MIQSFPYIVHIIFIIIKDVLIIRCPRFFQTSAENIFIYIILICCRPGRNNCDLYNRFLCLVHGFIFNPLPRKVVIFNKLGTISGTKYSGHWSISYIGFIGILEGYITWEMVAYVTVEHATQSRTCHKVLGTFSLFDFS